MRKKCQDIGRELCYHNGMEIKDIENAIEYIERHLTEKIDYDEVARAAFSSSWHFQRVFGLVCGITLGEYIRRRRLSEAANELISGKKVLDVALMHGYETSESFSRAFKKFHGVNPSQVGSSPLKYFPRLALHFQENGGSMDCIIKELPAMILTGYKKRFHGVPYGKEREEQENKFYSTTRAKQWLLLGAACDYSTEYSVVTNIRDDGYDFYIAYALDEWTRRALYDKSVTGVDFIEKLGFETIEIPEQTYAVFQTQKVRYPLEEYTDIRRRIAVEWLPSSGFELSDAPEIVALRWRPLEKEKWHEERNIEIRLPVKRV